VKFFILLIILILTSCSLDKNSSFWNENWTKKSFENKKLLKNSTKNLDLNLMTFQEFNIFLKDYANKKDYPDISK
jgi:hypothetical protein